MLFPSVSRQFVLERFLGRRVVHAALLPKLLLAKSDTGILGIPGSRPGGSSRDRFHVDCPQWLGYKFPRHCHVTLETFLVSRESDKLTYGVSSPPVPAMTRLPILTVILALGGCTATTAEYKRSLDSLLYAPADELIEAWGPAGQSLSAERR